MVACLTQIICFLNWEILRCSQVSLEKKKEEIEGELRGKWLNYDWNLLDSHTGVHALGSLQITRG